MSDRIASMAPRRPSVTGCIIAPQTTGHPFSQKQSADDHNVIPGDEWRDEQWHRDQGGSGVSVNGDGWPATKCAE